jgi:GNAT superfamily N-acetyltransferase
MDRVLLDVAMIDRLERSSARVAATSAGRLGAPVAPWLNGVMIAMGAGRYINRAIGVGTSDVTAQDVVALEAFFRDAGMPPSIEVPSWASPGLLRQIGDRGFAPDWFRNVYVRDVAPRDGGAGGATERAGRIVVRRVGDDLVGPWLQTLAEGNGISDPAARRVSDEFARGRLSHDGSTTLLAFVDGQPAGCGSLEIDDAVGWVGGAATTPALRNSGVQTALLHERLALAAAAGCDLVAATALPMGGSARNLLRNGFDQAYAQLVMTVSPGR